MMTGWEDNPYQLESWSEARQRAYLESCPAFDPLTSRADSRELGILAEYLRTYAGARRSAHPISSYAAMGRYATTLTEHHALQYHHGEDSPLARLCALEGRILLLGDLFDNIALLHHAEHLAHFPNKRVVQYQMPILQNGRATWVQLEEFDTDEILDGAGDYFGRLVQSFHQGHGNYGKVGNANAYLFEAKELLEYAVTWMEQEFN
jgi:aminoglycoside 3-N-acetyltransferase